MWFAGGGGGGGVEWIDCVFAGNNAQYKQKKEMWAFDQNTDVQIGGEC